MLENEGKSPWVIDLGHYSYALIDSKDIQDAEPCSSCNCWDSYECVHFKPGGGPHL